MADPIITPELVETAAAALYRQGKFRHLTETGKARYRSDAAAVLAVVAPLIDRAARADELGKQAAALRDMERLNLAVIRERGHPGDGRKLGHLHAENRLLRDLAQRYEQHAAVPTEEN